MKPAKKEAPAKKFRRAQRAEAEVNAQQLVPKVLGKLRKASTKLRD